MPTHPDRQASHHAVPIHTIRPLLELVDFEELAEYVRERGRSPPLCGTPSGPTTRAPSTDLPSPETMHTSLPPTSQPPPRSKAHTLSKRSDQTHTLSKRTGQTHTLSKPLPGPATWPTPLRHALHTVSLDMQVYHTIKDVPRLKLLHALRKSHLWEGIADHELARLLQVHQDWSLCKVLERFPPGRVPDHECVDASRRGTVCAPRKPKKEGKE